MSVLKPALATLNFGIGGHLQNELWFDPAPAPAPAHASGGRYATSCR